MKSQESVHPRQSHKRGKGASSLLGVLAVAGAAGTAYYLTRSGKSQARAHDSAPGRTARHGHGAYAVTGRTVTIARPRHELYSFWRDFANLPQFMDNIEAVDFTGADRTVWKIKAPVGTVDVETEVVSDEDGRLIAWRSVPGSDIETEGRVEFHDAPGDRGTRVTAIIAYKPPAGAAGRAIAKLTPREPAIQARHDLKRLKMLMETGEIATGARNRALNGKG